MCMLGRPESVMVLIQALTIERMVARGRNSASWWVGGAGRAVPRKLSGGYSFSLRLVPLCFLLLTHLQNKH